MGSILGLLASLVSGFISNKSAKNTQAGLTDIQKGLHLPPALLQAENIYANNANTGLPGYENAKTENRTRTATTLNGAKDYLTSGGLVDALGKLYTQESENARTLESANDQALINNRNAYAGFLTHKAGAEQGLTDTNNELALSKLGVERSATQDKLNFANKGAESMDITKMLTTLMQTPGMASILGGLLGKNKGLNWTSGSDTGNNLLGGTSYENNSSGIINHE